MYLSRSHSHEIYVHIHTHTWSSRILLILPGAAGGARKLSQRAQSELLIKGDSAAQRANRVRAANEQPMQVYTLNMWSCVCIPHRACNGRLYVFCTFFCILVIAQPLPRVTVGVCMCLLSVRACVRYSHMLLSFYINRFNQPLLVSFFSLRVLCW